MQTINRLTELRAATRAIKAADKSLALVPTMGALHAGHLQLVAEAKKRADVVAVSIFVNPTQFGPTEDLSKYPRDLERDLNLISPLGVDLVWNPTAEVMYPTGYQTWVEVEAMT